MVAERMAVRDLVAAFGSSWMRDLSFGLKVLQRLRESNIDDSMLLADWSFGTITAFQKLCEQPFRRVVLVGAATRELEPRRLHLWQPASTLPDQSEIHQRICDCVMGMVSLENLLIMAQFYGKLPQDVLVIEAEAVDQTWGEELSADVAPLVAPAAAVAQQFVETGVVPSAEAYSLRT